MNYFVIRSSLVADVREKPLSSIRLNPRASPSGNIIDLAYCPTGQTRPRASHASWVTYRILRTQGSLTHSLPLQSNTHRPSLIINENPSCAPWVLANWHDSCGDMVPEWIALSEPTKAGDASGY